tara:strand:+ start:4173 stop:5048 length:876 start_codon:yes stop_codon:yes gene_type:complete
MDKSNLIFPLEIGNQPERPLIKFTAYDRKDGNPDQHHIYLPSPAGISFTEQADFSSVDLGMVAATAISATQGGVSNAAGSIKAGDILKTATSATPIGENFDFQSKTIKNPNTNTTFKANGMRNFSFAFKLVARNEKESVVIRKIHSKFRHFTYAARKGGSSNFVVDFPPVWTIRFMDQGKESLSENKYIPRIFSCYLTQCNSVFNADANIYHNDSAPLVIDMNITYQETRALTRNDIEDMENDQLQNRGIDQETGNPVIAGVPTQGAQEQEPGASSIPQRVSTTGRGRARR